MSPLSPCGAYMSVRYSREKCLPCNGKGCKCCQQKGRHYMPGVQENPGGSSRPLRRVIEGEFKKRRVA